MGLHEDFIRETVAQVGEETFMHRLRFERVWDHEALKRLLTLMYALVREYQQKDVVDKAIARGFYTCIDGVPRFAAYDRSAYAGNTVYIDQAMKLFNILTDSLFSTEERFISSFEEEMQHLDDLAGQVETRPVPEWGDDVVIDPFELTLDPPQGDGHFIQSPEDILLEEWQAFEAGELEGGMLGERYQDLTLAQMDAELGVEHPEWGLLRTRVREEDEFWRWMTPGGGQPTEYAGVGLSRNGRVFRTWVTLTT